MPANLDPGTGQHRPIRDQVPSAILSCGDMAYNSPTVVNKATKQNWVTGGSLFNNDVGTVYLSPTHLNRRAGAGGEIGGKRSGSLPPNRLATRALYEHYKLKMPTQWMRWRQAARW